jgi:ankyrin repeat protein
MGLRASPDAADEKGQKPIHLAAENNHSDVIKLFLKHQNSLVGSATRVSQAEQFVFVYRNFYGDLDFFW